MSVKRQVDETHSEVTISIEGRFDFSLHKIFRDAYRDLSPTTMRFVVDLGDASYLDSSALGMLLLLREHAGGERAQVRIINAQGDVMRVLKIANFDRLFAFD
ncbi:STAS domain-containing protein [Marichromatium gracile]|uniref:Anti-anti-sigma factor n=1 Tax=Marichromatium gracile TaxID=1048 RepID=A0A4R4A859_MARGR|nr:MULTISPECIES: STAS domain-containing protein [Marichromatium]MBK1708964.1 anti-anti-sigma factor [Marichromatium gracile]MCF1183690.1 STAS domain-containing protein [Marichromatium gracile]RNE91760.1 anti-sigma factor antagonist [Marichromatium sp. AB32]TCW34874.1 anti-anti-sigma factor [Marichromatium gracile]